MRQELLLCFWIFGLLLYCQWANCGISESRFQKLFRVDLAGVKSEEESSIFCRVPVSAFSGISWKEWVKKHVDASDGFPLATFTGVQPREQIPCSNADLLSKHTIKGSCCDVANDTCDPSMNLQCINYRCNCLPGSFLNDNNGRCEKRQGKQLTETCDPDVDNCYTAFSICISGVCQCMAGFKPDGLECLPQFYRCPFGDSLMAGTRPQPCDVTEGSSGSTNSSSDQCPSGYECIYPKDPYRPKFTTLSGEEKGYCCPLIPDLNQTILFQDQCFYGDWVPPLECPPSTHVYAFAISSTPLCCPKPCRPNYSSTIINGQCLEGVI